MSLYVFCYAPKLRWVATESCVGINFVACSFRSKAAWSKSRFFCSSFRRLSSRILASLASAAFCAGVLVVSYSSMTWVIIIMCAISRFSIPVGVIVIMSADVSAYPTNCSKSTIPLQTSNRRYKAGLDFLIPWNLVSSGLFIMFSHNFWSTDSASRATSGVFWFRRVVRREWICSSNPLPSILIS